MLSHWIQNCDFWVSPTFLFFFGLLFLFSFLLLLLLIASAFKYFAFPYTEFGLTDIISVFLIFLIQIFILRETQGLTTIWKY